MRKVRVCTFRRADRPTYEMQWKDPITGLKQTRTTDCTRKKDADREAIKLENELAEGAVVTKETDTITWAAFREFLENKVYRNQRIKTQWKTQSTLNAIERIVNPKLLCSLCDDDVISNFEDKLRDEGKRPYTVRGHMRKLAQVLRWAKKKKKISVMPLVEVPSAEGCKGRAITTEEYERMQALTAEEVGKKAAASYDLLLRGLWWSGFRIDEAMSLNWDHGTGFAIDLTHEFPMIQVAAFADKTGKDRVLPLAPEFCEMILAIPEERRHGFFFNPVPRRGELRERLSTEWVGKVIGKIGELAGVKVADGRRNKGTTPKYASAHDFRRAFGFRWAMRVLPPVLMELMRHDDIKTTMKFYVGRHAEVAAKAARDALANIFANKSQEPTGYAVSKPPKPLENIECTSVGSNHQPSVP
jgi:integrase